jgi:hypothetical protein
MIAAAVVIAGMLVVSAAHAARDVALADWLTIVGGALILGGAAPLLLGIVL